jgi:hypothetical protein
MLDASRSAHSRHRQSRRMQDDDNPVTLGIIGNVSKARAAMGWSRLRGGQPDVEPVCCPVGVSWEQP